MIESKPSRHNMQVTAPSFEKVIPKVIDFRDRAYPLHTGLERGQRYTFPILGLSDNQPVNAAITLDAGDSILVPHIYVYADVTYTLAAADPTAQEVGIKCMGLNNLFTQVNVNLSGEQFSTPTAALCEIAPKILPQAVLQRLSSNYLYDQCSGTLGADVYPAAGMALSVLRDASATGCYEGLRGAGNVDMQFGRVGNATTLRLRTRCELMAAPFAFDSEYEKPGFIGLQRMNISMSGMSWLTNLLQLGVGNWAAPTGVLINTFEIEYYVIRAPSTVETGYATIPYSTVRMVHEVATHGAGTAIPVYANGVTATYALTSTAQYVSVPHNLEQNCRKIIIWASPDRTTRTAMTATYAYGINTLEISYKSGTFFGGGWNDRHLYNMSKKNGLNLTYEQFRGTPFKRVGQTVAECGIGSIIVIDPLTDLASDSFGAISDQRCTFQLRASWFNTSPVAIPAGGMTVNVMFIYADRVVWHNKESMFTRETNIITSKDLIYSDSMPVVYAESIDSARGGNIFSGISSFVKNKAVPWLQKNKGAIKDAIGAIPGVGTAANAALGAVGYGKGGRGKALTEGGSNMSGGLKLI